MAQHYQEAGAELPPRHHPEIDDRVAAADFPWNHEHERQRADRSEGDDE